MKEVTVWQVVRWFTVKWEDGSPMMYPIANFEREQDAIELARILDEEPMHEWVKSRRHTVEPLTLHYFESVRESLDSR